MQKFEELEIKFAEWNKVDPACMVAVNSGTSALHLACEVLVKLRPRYFSILIPEFTMVACARAASMALLRPKFIDVGNDLLISDSNEESYNQVIMPVHVYGRQCKFDSYLNGDVIEDLAEAHGIQPNPKSFAACWSFYKNKIVRGEEGGAVWFREREGADLARKLRCLGFTEQLDYWHIPRGINARMSNLHATPIIQSLSQVDSNLRRRREQVHLYDSLIPSNWRMPERTVDWVYDLRIPGLTGSLQSKIVSNCIKNGIPARHGFKPLSKQIEYQEAGYATKSLNAERLAIEIIYLPLGPEFSDQDITKMAGVFKQICRYHGVAI